MKYAFFILILTSICIAHVPTQYIEPQLNYTKQQLQNQQGYSTLVSIEGVEKFVVDEQGRIIETPDEIYQLLLRNVAKSSGFEQEVQDTKTLIDRREKKRVWVQQECYRLTGMDKFDCYDKDSCILVAFSTPISSTAVNADGFWEYMLDYKTKNVELKNLVVRLEKKLIDSAQEQTARDIVELMEKMADVEEKLEQNALFLTIYDDRCMGSGARDCFEYCPKLNWSEDKKQFYDEINKWRMISSNLSDAANQDHRATQIYMQTQDWGKYLKNRHSIYEQASENVSGVQTKIQNAMDTAEYKKLNGTQMQARYGEWEEEFVSSHQLYEEGQIYNSIKKLDELEVEGQQIYFDVKKNVEKIKRIEDATKNIESALDEIGEDGQTQNHTLDIKMRLERFNSSIVYPIRPRDLGDIVRQIEQVENDTLIIYAKSKLGIGFRAQSPEKDKIEGYAQIFSNVIEAIIEFLNRLYPISI